MKLNRREAGRWAGALFGALLFSASINLLLVPMNFYNGGVVGIGQILRTVLVRYAGLSLPFDVAGILVYVINIPLFILAYKQVGRRFLLRTLACLTAQTVFMTLIPIPAAPIISDPLTVGLIGGFASGYGVGLMLKNGGSGGGLDIMGVYMALKKPNYSVGRLAIMVNCFVYGVCLLLFDVQTVVYSLIFTIVQSIAMDRMHLQNINVEALIFTKRADDALPQAIMTQLQRGVTEWEGRGAYTGQTSRILYVVVSKYEVPTLKHIVHEVDEKAFVAIKEGVDVSRNFVKRL